MVYTRILGIVVLRLLVVSSAFVACNSERQPAPKPSPPEVGLLKMALKLSSGVTVNTIAYKVSGGVPALPAPITGDVDVSDPAATLTFFVGGIPAGTGFRA